MNPMLEDVDLVMVSGREGMDVCDRFELLAADAEWLASVALQPPPSGPRGARVQIEQWWRVNGESVHDHANLVMHLRGICLMFELGGRRGQLAVEGLSEAECDVLAWRRGGHQELKQIKLERRTRARREVVA